MLLKTVRADRIYEGHDLSWLGAELQPDRIVTAADLEKDGIVFPRRIRPIRSCRRARCRCSSAIRWRS